MFIIYCQVIDKKSDPEHLPRTFKMKLIMMNIKNPTNLSSTIVLSERNFLIDTV